MSCGVFTPPWEFAPATALRWPLTTWRHYSGIDKPRSLERSFNDFVLRTVASTLMQPVPDRRRRTSRMPNSIRAPLQPELSAPGVLRRLRVDGAGFIMRWRQCLVAFCHDRILIAREGG